MVTAILYRYRANLREVYIVATIFDTISYYTEQNILIENSNILTHELERRRTLYSAYKDLEEYISIN